MNQNEEPLDKISDNTEIEIEKYPEVSRLPFNINSVKVKPQPLNIGQLVELLSVGMINFDTDFQRRAYLWDNTKQSQFIESIILNLPVPVFFFFENRDGILEIVDGLQRISAIKNFITNDKLPLIGLEFLSSEEFEGKTFSELSSAMQWRIKLTSLNISILEKGTPDQVKYILFKRLNKGGLTLTLPEIRNAIYRNGGAQLVAELTQINVYGESGEMIKEATVEGKAFVKATHYKIETNRMQDREWATRFVAFYLLGWNKYNNNLEFFLNEALEEVSKLDLVRTQKLKNDFVKSMKTIYIIFKEYSFRKLYGLNEKKRPINIALFEALSVCFAKCNETQILLLLDKAEVFQKKFIDLHNLDERFLSSITNGTYKKENIKTRFEKIQTIINETCNDF